MEYIFYNFSHEQSSHSNRSKHCQTDQFFRMENDQNIQNMQFFSQHVQDKQFSKKISRKISFENSNIEQQNIQSQIQIKQHHSCPQKTQKRKFNGLRKLSVLVFQVVCQMGVSSYRKVADRLVNKLESNNIQQNNIRRRVYDALNVMISAKILSKQGKQVVCNKNSELINLRGQRGKKIKQISQKKVSIQEKIEKQKVLKAKRQALRKVFSRNKLFQQEKIEKIEIPFVAAKVATGSVCKLTHNSKQTIIKLNQSFKVVGDVDLLLEIQPLVGKQ